MTAERNGSLVRQLAPIAGIVAMAAAIVAVLAGPSSSAFLPEAAGRPARIESLSPPPVSGPMEVAVRQREPRASAPPVSDLSLPVVFAAPAPATRAAVAERNRVVPADVVALQAFPTVVPPPDSAAAPESPMLATPSTAAQEQATSPAQQPASSNESVRVAAAADDDRKRTKQWNDDDRESGEYDGDRGKPDNVGKSDDKSDDKAERKVAAKEEARETREERKTDREAERGGSESHQATPPSRDKDDD